MIRLSEVSKAYRTKELETIALDHVDLQIRRRASSLRSWGRRDAASRRC